ncbi:MAG: acyltransferase [Marinilabiliaceae bacterium]|nr:acyltransferase [Marinilabiliaceae bacterium]
MTNPHNRLTVLDAFRGIAALAVVLYHYTIRYSLLYDFETPSFMQVFKYGYLGVHLFFIISGFVIFMTIQKNNTPLLFLYKRFTRLYPTYWICLIVTLLAVSIFSLTGRHISITASLINFSMFQEALNIPHVDGSYWSLTIELFFYLQIAFLLALKSIKHLYYWATLFLLLFISNKIIHIPLKSFYLNLHYSPLFLAGIFFYKLKFLKTKWIDHIFIICCLISYVFFSKSHAEQIIITLFFILFYFFVYNKLEFIGIKPLLFLGEISYALYLLHQNIGYIIMNVVRDYTNNYSIVLLTPIFFSIILAWLVTKYAERPLMKTLRNTSLLKLYK